MTLIGLILRILNSLLMIGIPCLLVVILVRRGRGGFRTIGIGLAGFVLSQVGHIPFNQFVLLPVLEGWGFGGGQSGWQLLALGAALGLSAGIFEEAARYAAFRYWLVKNPNTMLPVKYGVGHGGSEAFLLGILTLFALIQVMVLGGEGALSSFPPEQAELIQAQITAYWEVPWQQSLLGAWERVSALAFHIGASLMVYKSIREKNPAWLAVAIIGHAMFNAFAVIFSRQLDFVLLESILFVFALGWLYWSWSVRVIELEQPHLDQPLPRKPHLTAQRITPEQLEESRYDE
ncbi:MAG: YhfC family glutamic-type intramembrane protease [Anaerolineales bacterium]